MVYAAQALKPGARVCLPSEKSGQKGGFLERKGAMWHFTVKFVPLTEEKGGKLIKMSDNMIERWPNPTPHP